jgi:hypothetical protein
MRIEQLQEALDRYGGDLGRWPASARAEAEALLARDPEAARMAGDAVRLNALLAEAVQPLPVDAGFIGRVIAGVSSGGHRDVPLHPTPRLAAWAGAATVALLVTGYAVGLAMPQSQGEDVFAGLVFGDSSASDVDSGSVL